MSCPYTSPQNGRAERILRTLNNITRSLLVHASMPYTLWVEALNTATFLLNRRPCRSCHNHTPFFLLYGVQPTYTNMCVFGCLCYPNLTSTSAHKLAPRSHPCVFLGYSPEHKGYRYLNRSTGRVVISRYVVFDERSFPFAPDGVPPRLALRTALTINSSPSHSTSRANPAPRGRIPALLLISPRQRRQITLRLPRHHHLLPWPRDHLNRPHLLPPPPWLSRTPPLPLHQLAPPRAALHPHTPWSPVANLASFTQTLNTPT